MSHTVIWVGGTSGLAKTYLEEMVVPSLGVPKTTDNVRCCRCSLLVSLCRLCGTNPLERVSRPTTLITVRVS
jgi:hypothetical protein